MTDQVKAFISYSWTSPDHEEWVLQLAHRLMSDGIDVILDKWELQPGRDPIVFMEQMVTDATVRKVLMICDRVYKAKADGREGGVGKEAQILTREIYEKAAENKYAALITERDEEGKACVPTYYHSKQYIDFTDSVKQEEKYQELLRWLYDRPQHKKPRIGSAPAFITEPSTVVTGTTSKLRIAEQFIKQGNSAAGGAVADFGEALVAEYEELRPKKIDGEPWDETVIKAAESLRSGLRNLFDLILADARHGGLNLERILKLFEKLGSFMFRPPSITRWSEDDYDPYRMMCYEGFLGLAAILISEDRFDLLGRALNRAYLVPNREALNGPATASFSVFFQDVSSFRQRNERLQARRIDMYADVIAETYQASFPPLAQMLQADLLLYLRVNLLPNVGYEHWWPRTILYHGKVGMPELFARSESESFFRTWSPHIFGNLSIEQFKEGVTELNKNARFHWGQSFMGPSLERLTNLAHLADRP